VLIKAHKTMFKFDKPDAFDLPFPIIPRLYDRVLVINYADRRSLVIAWRWLPVVRWRYLSRAWQGEAPPGCVLATDWTGRTRELIGWEWPIAARRWQEIDLVMWQLESALQWRDQAA
jgi:hypothetical protein